MTARINTEPLCRDSYDPNEWVWIHVDDIDREKLDKKGVRYKYIEHEYGRGYMVEKSEVQKLCDYTVRTLATPVTVVIDCVPLIIYVGAMLSGNATTCPQTNSSAN